MKFIEDPPEGTYLPAMYKDADVTGQHFGMYRVIGRSGTRRYKNGNIHALWTVVCEGCDTEKQIPAYNVTRAKYGCHTCAHKVMSRTNHARWKGGKYVPGYFVAQSKAGAKRATRTLEWSLTFEYLDNLWLNQSGRCAYTGWDLQFGRAGLLAQEQTASLDRVDSDKGYVEGNVQFVHKDVNRLKWDHSEERFLELCNAISTFRKKVQ